LASDALAPSLTEKLGRAFVIRSTNWDNAVNDATEALKAKTALKQAILNAPKNKRAILLPDINFWRKCSDSLISEIQSRPADAQSIVDYFHSKYFNVDFTNPEKKYMRGAYILRENIGFQKDRIHESAYLGAKSREDKFHILNANYIFGVRRSLGEHFDVCRETGDPIKEIFDDVLTGEKSNPLSKHLNITPCDRIV
jgi:hypothetical protein